MGDRTTVTLTVLTSQSKKVKEFIKDRHDTERHPNDQLVMGEHTHFHFAEVGGGELDFLPSLHAAGIAYESAWDDGQEFGPGIEVCRFTSAGEAIVKTITGSDEAILLTQLVCLLDKPDQLRELITNRVNENDYLPWENQEEYGKLYLVNQLINPSQP